MDEVNSEHSKNQKICFSHFPVRVTVTTFACVRPLRMMGMFTDGPKGTTTCSCLGHRGLKKQMTVVVCETSHKEAPRDKNQFDKLRFWVW